MKKYFSLLCFLCAMSSYAYTPSALVETQAIAISKKINAYIERLTWVKKTNAFKVFSTQLPLLQNKLIPTGDIVRMYLFEYIRRHLPGVEIIDTPDLIDDDDIWYTWTHAPNGFDIFYFQRPVPPFWSLDFQNYSTLINGSYFSKMEWGIYPSGFLYFSGQIYTEFLTEDKQITHMYCQKNNRIDIWENSRYVSEEDTIQKCDTAFQAGPLIYSLHDNHVSENLALKTYIWSAHPRTIMVIFESSEGKQDIWFLTVYKDKTFTQIRDMILSETRFYATYKNIDILNLDGGSSVAYRSQKYPELNFWKAKTLPIVFGIR